jgi:ADP-heptose:LPS heptosyltransferase
VNRVPKPSVASHGSEQAALAGLVKMGRAKRLLVRIFEMIAGPIVFVWDRLRPSPNPVSAEPRSILILEYWNLGDLVMELPFLRNLRIQYPRAHIVLLTSPKVAPLLRHQGLVDRIVTVRVPWTEHYSRWRKYNPFSSLWFALFRTLISLRAQRFDLAFAARADLRENLIMWLVNARRRVAYGFGGGAFFLTDAVKPDLQHPHFSRRWLRLLEQLGKPALVTQPSLRLAGHEERFADCYLAQHGLGDGDFIVGIHAGGRSATRQWGEENFAAVAERLQSQFPVRIVWFQDPRQAAPAQESQDFLRVSLPLRHFMAVLSRCRLLICNDSGPMHIATALGVPVVAVFGPTEPTWFGPLGRDNQLVIQPGFWCRPCFDYCRFDQPHCLRTISLDSVFEASAKSVAALLKRSTRGEQPIRLLTSDEARANPVSAERSTRPARPRTPGL